MNATKRPATEFLLRQLTATAAMRDYYGQLFPKTDKDSDLEKFAEYDFKYKVLDTELEKRFMNLSMETIIDEIQTGETFCIKC